MTNLITREIISRKLSFIDIPNQILNHRDIKFSFDEFSTLVDKIKNLLQFIHKCKEGESVLIGLPTSTRQIATFFACAELGLQIIIVDYSRDDEWIDKDYIDPKTKQLLPINYFIVWNKNDHPKWRLFQKICDKTITLINLSEYNNSKPNNYIGCKPDSILLKCTSSGTTGTPKLVIHNHNFLYNLVLRNSKFFYGNVCMGFNLNHGSSLATYFLPALCSIYTNKFVSWPDAKVLLAGNQQAKSFQNRDANEQTYKILFYNKFTKFNFDHLMIPYTHLIESFLLTGDYPLLKIYTLSSLKKHWLTLYQNKKIGDIISFFGSNETSGPTLINKLSTDNFEELKYQIVDDFYKINLINDQDFEVGLPFYNKNILTNDKFKLENGQFIFKGRNDLYRINGSFVDLEFCNTLETLHNCNIVIDTLQNEIYLAIWDNVEPEGKVKMIDQQLSEKSNNVYHINKFQVLDKNKFLSGIKLDMELLRDYFRKYV